MQHRQLRLGDVLDDYCPRERRITNHAVVAMVGQDVKQTRCITCEAEHEYRHAKAPASRRKKPGPAALDEVLAGMPEAKLPSAAAPPSQSPADTTSRAAADSLEPAPPEPVSAEDTHDAEPALAAEEEGPVHRRLIRATLPRPEGQPIARPLPDFTMRRPGPRHEGPPSYRGHTQPGSRSPNGASRGGFSRMAGPKSDRFGNREGHRPSRRGHGSRRGKKHSK